MSDGSTIAAVTATLRNLLHLRTRFADPAPGQTSLTVTSADHPGRRGGAAHRGRSSPRTAASAAVRVVLAMVWRFAATSPAGAAEAPGCGRSPRHEAAGTHQRTITSSRGTYGANSRRQTTTSSRHRTSAPLRFVRPPSSAGAVTSNRARASGRPQRSAVVVM